MINFSCCDNFINFRKVVKHFFRIGKNFAIFMTFVMEKKAINDNKRAFLGAFMQFSFFD